MLAVGLVVATGLILAKRWADQTRRSEADRRRRELIERNMRLDWLTPEEVWALEEGTNRPRLRTTKR